MDTIPARALLSNPAPGSDGASSDPLAVLFDDPLRTPDLQTPDLMDFNSDQGSIQHDDQLNTHVAFASTAALIYTSTTGMANAAAANSCSVVSGDDLSQWMDTLLDASKDESTMNITGHIEDISPIRVAKIPGTHSDYFDQLLAEGTDPDTVEAMRLSAGTALPSASSLPNVAACSSQRPPPPPTSTRPPTKPTIDLLGAREDYVSYGKADTDNFQSFKRMTSTFDPFPTQDHSPNKGELHAYCHNFQLQMAELKEENKSLKEKGKNLAECQHNFAENQRQVSLNERTELVHVQKQWEARATQEMNDMKNQLAQQQGQNEQLASENKDLAARAHAAWQQQEAAKANIVQEAQLAIHQKDQEKQDQLMNLMRQENNATGEMRGQFENALGQLESNHQGQLQTYQAEKQITDQAIESGQQEIQRSNDQIQQLQLLLQTQQQKAQELESNQNESNRAMAERTTLLNKELLKAQAVIKFQNLAKPGQSGTQMLKPAPLNFGASEKQKDEEIEKIREQHEKEKKDLENKAVNDKNNATLQVKIEMDKEKHMLKQQLEKYAEQVANMEKIIEQEKQKSSKTQAKAKAKSKARSDSQPPPEPQEDTFHSIIDEEDDADDEEEEEYWPGWRWEGDDDGEWVEDQQAPLYTDLNDEERFQYARQNEAQTMTFDPWPLPGKVQIWCISNHEKIAAGSIIPDKAMRWWKEAEDPKYTGWEQLPQDPPFLIKFGQKCAAGLMELIKKKPELKMRIDSIKVQIWKDCKQLSGRALYWIILNELRTSANTIGLMNITDLQNVTCRGHEINHLRNFHTYWLKCLENFPKIPGDEILQPLYEKQVMKCKAFEQTFTLYEVTLVTEKLDRSYNRLFEMVVRYLAIEHKKENDRLAAGQTEGWSMAACETAVVKYGPGDCKAKFYTGRCNRDNCSFQHHNFLPAELRKGGKKGKGKAKREKAKAKEKEKEREREKAKVKENQKEKGKVKGKEKERKEKVKNLVLAISATEQGTLQKIATLRRATGDKINKVHKTTNLDNGQNQIHPEQDALHHQKRTDLCVTTSSLEAVAKEVIVLFGTRVCAMPSRKEHVM